VSFSIKRLPTLDATLAPTSFSLGGLGTERNLTDFASWLSDARSHFSLHSIRACPPGVALAFVAAVLLGFLLHPRKEVFHVRTTRQLRDPDRNPILEHDYLAVKAELTRLWLLFLPTLLAVGFLVVSSASGSLSKFSFLDSIFSTEYAPIALFIWHAPPVIVVILLSAWISERRVMKDAEACSARSCSMANRAVSYLFMGERGEYYGGYRYCFGLVRPMQLAAVVFHNVRKPELNKIAMGSWFHRLVILGRGVTDWTSKQLMRKQSWLKRFLDRTARQVGHRKPTHSPNLPPPQIAERSFS
jgi:hypothetical protein